MEMGRGDGERQPFTSPLNPAERLFLMAVMGGSVLGAVIFLHVYGWLP
jgi:hypothetical protein